MYRALKKIFMYVFGNCSKNDMDWMFFDGRNICQTNLLRYVFINGNKNLNFGVQKRSVCAALNNIYVHGGVSLNCQQLHNFKVCWDNVYRSVFNLDRWQSVKTFYTN